MPAAVVGPPMLNRAGAPDGATAVILTAEGGGLLVAPDQGWVKRFANEHRYTSGYAELRRRFSRHVPAPGFEISEGGRVLTEEFVQGQHISELPSQAQIEAVRTLLRQLATLVAVEGEGSAAQFMEQMLARVEGTRLPEDLRQQLAQDQFGQIAARGPLVPSRGGLGTQNVIAVGPGLTVIDWPSDRITLRPFWFDALELMTASLSAPFREGVFDRDVARLWEAAGVESPDLRTHRDVLVAAHCLASASLTTAPESGGADAMLATRTVVKRWQTWGSVLAATT